MATVGRYSVALFATDSN